MGKLLRLSSLLTSNLDLFSWSWSQPETRYKYIFFRHYSRGHESIEKWVQAAVHVGEQFQVDVHLRIWYTSIKHPVKHIIKEGIHSQVWPPAKDVHADNEDQHPHNLQGISKSYLAGVHDWQTVHPFWEIWFSLDESLKHHRVTVMVS